VTLQVQLYLAAGLGALALGVGALVREPGRRRNRLFALFCAALALWNLAKVAELSGLGLTVPWHVVFLLGVCAAVPTGLHFIFLVSGLSDQPSRRLLPYTYATTAALWVSALTPVYHRQPAWNLTALLVLGGLLFICVKVLLRHMHSLPGGLHRNAVRLITIGAAIGVVGGLSDLLPRGPDGPIKIGPVAVLFFLLVLCSVLVRYRFLDVESFLAEVLAMIVGAVVVSVSLHAVSLAFGGGLFPLFVAAFLLLSVRGPIWRALLSGFRSLLGGGDPVAQALIAVSGGLHTVQEPGEVWKVFDAGLNSLPGNLHIEIFLRRVTAEPFRLAYRSNPDSATSRTEADRGLPALLERERSPVTRRFLEVEATETWGERRERAAAALAQLEACGAELAVPLLRGDFLAGWIAIAGEHLREFPSAEMAAAFLAVGNQALAGLDRIEAQAEARRREALAAVGEMAAGLAHEVRNPLGALRGAAQVLASGTTAARSREMLEVIQDETGRLGRVVGDFLDYARPAPPQREPVDVAELTRRVLRSASAAGLSLRAELQVTSEATRALGDPDQLQRAFANLVQNASEAAGPGGFLRIEVGRDGSGRVTIRFQDNGPGIPPEQMARLFQPFHTTKPGGTGLGLALVHRVVESHGGELRVDGRPGLGAAFTLALPGVAEAT
jgi:signal transduction histidine kinase